MQTNTAEVSKQPINFANFSVENKPYKSDPFTIKDGHYVGHDGFIVPKNFDEFHERFPQYVRNWVDRHSDRTASKEDVEDWTQDLLFHLQRLPANSKYREAGKEDIVQTFDPHKHYGANQARFQNYINLCLTNKFRTLHSKRMKDALSQPGNVSLDTRRESGDPFSVTDEFCHWHSDHLQRAANASEKQDQDRASIAEFMGFVRREDPNALPAVEALCLAQAQGAAGVMCGRRTSNHSARAKLSLVGVRRGPARRGPLVEAEPWQFPSVHHVFSYPLPVRKSCTRAPKGRPPSSEFCFEFPRPRATWQSPRCD